MHKTLVVCCAVAISALSLPATAQTPLRVVSTGAAPFGEEGFCGDFMPAIAEIADFEFEFVPPLGLADIMPAVANGQADIVCSALGGAYFPITTPPTTANGYRALGLAFTGTVYLNFETLVVLATDTTPYTSFADFRGQPVGATAGATIYLGILDAAGITDVHTFATNADALNALIAGEVKAVIQGAPSIRYVQSLGQFPEVREVETYQVQRVIQAALAVRNSDIELLGRLQAALETLKVEGTLGELTANWGLGNPPM
ncbi:MAG: substrate-binding periplasmic protein [Bauldia sp.]